MPSSFLWFPNPTPTFLGLPASHGVIELRVFAEGGAAEPGEISRSLSALQDPVSIRSAHVRRTCAAVEKVKIKGSVRNYLRREQSRGEH